MSEQPIKITMIDDDEGDFFIVNETIKQAVPNRYVMEWASTYEEGLKYIAENRSEVYLVDYHLGVYSGMDLIKEAIRKGCQEPLIIFTGQNDQDVDKEAMEAGASDYLVKGNISGPVLERSIRYAIANSRHRKEILKLNSELEERVKQRTRKLEETLDELKHSQHELILAKVKSEQAAMSAEKAAHAKQQFLSNMSHEIRTPMNAIIGFTRLLEKTTLTEEQSEFVQAVKTSGENLLVIINDVLDFSKGQSGKIAFEKTSFSVLHQVDSILDLMAPKAKEKGLLLHTSFDRSIPEHLMGDPARLNQILINLLGNAIKFTEHGEVRISVENRSDTNNHVEVEFKISDTGIGIPGDKLTTIFEEFSQASNDITRKYGGSGLGLAIVKQLVEAQGGKINVKSTEGKGSVFTFVLGFAKDDNHRVAPAKKELNEESRLKGLSVLLVEDNVLNQKLAMRVMADWDWSVDLAENGEKAIAAFNSHQYDLILLDIQLPDMDGYSIANYIRKSNDPEKNNTPIIAMTAHAMVGEAAKCFDAGMNAHVSKPFNPDILYKQALRVAHPKPVLPR